MTLYLSTLHAACKPRAALDAATRPGNPRRCWLVLGGSYHPAGATFCASIHDALRLALATTPAVPGVVGRIYLGERLPPAGAPADRIIIRGRRGAIMCRGSREGA